jgi:glutathione S-transferase
MPKPVLFLGNKAYSSWSMRAYLPVLAAGIEFDQVVIPLYVEHSMEELIKAGAPAGKVCELGGIIYGGYNA